MIFVRDRAEARWLPSRHHFALFKLAGFLRLLKAKPEPRPGLMLAVARDQSKVENYGFAIWFLMSVAGFFFPWLPLPLPIALVVSVLLAAITIQFPCYFMGVVVIPLVTRTLLRNNHRANLTLLLTCGAAAAVYYALQPSWVRLLGWQYLGVLTLNAVSAVLVRLLRNRIARQEQSFGGVSFAD
ncbi:MAG TPA: hypothetical protein VGF69_24815 [Thermoanaerobaculia bacterium]|jgi:hypothetical protein